MFIERAVSNDLFWIGTVFKMDLIVVRLVRRHLIRSSFGKDITIFFILLGQFLLDQFLFSNLFSLLFLELLVFNGLVNLIETSDEHFYILIPYVLFKKCQSY